MLVIKNLKLFVFFYKNCFLWKNYLCKRFIEWLKQNLKIKKFIGKSRTAINIQICIALITYLLIKILEDKLHEKWYIKDNKKNKISIRQLLLLFKTGLFTSELTTYLEYG